MTAEPLRVGINGFGRIGRTVARIIAQRDDLEVAAINDIAEDVPNLAYLYNYDSNFGTPQVRARAQMGSRSLAIGDREIPVFCERDIAAADWHHAGAQVIIDSSGVFDNVLSARRLVDEGRVAKVIVTHSPASGIDRHIVLGINEADYDPRQHHVISSSICDANAIAHPLYALDKTFGIDEGYVTTLHPWLSYQNLVDAPLSSQSNPGHFWKDYSLGRASVGAIFPKNTTAVAALRPILPSIVDRLGSFSYRIPTAIVTSADMTLRLSRAVSLEEVRDCIETLVAQSPYLAINEEALVSVDYLQSPASAVFDMQWLGLCGDRLLKVVVWYDNEWGYSSRVADLAGHLVKR